MTNHTSRKNHRLFAALSFAMALAVSLAFVTGITRADQNSQCGQDQIYLSDDYAQLGVDQGAQTDAETAYESDRAYMEYYCNAEAPGYQLDLCQSYRAYEEIDLSNYQYYTEEVSLDQAQIRQDQEAVSEDCTTGD